MAKIIDPTELELKEIAAAQAALDARMAAANKRKELKEKFEEFAKKEQFDSGKALFEFLYAAEKPKGKRGRPPGSTNKAKAADAKPAKKSKATKRPRSTEADVKKAIALKKAGKTLEQIAKATGFSVAWVQTKVSPKSAK